MKHEILTVGAFEVNCGIVWGSDKQAWVIDPGENAPRILETLQRQGLRPVRILLTHGHIDHIAALDQLLQRYPGLAVMLHADDARWAFCDLNRFPPYNVVPQPPATLQSLSDNDLLADGDLRARILHTPGHSPGSVCFWFEEAGILFSGDTLFAGSVGRTDLPGGNGARLAESLRKLATLPPELEVIAGHGPWSTIEEELRSNPFMRIRSR